MSSENKDWKNDKCQLETLKFLWDSMIKCKGRGGSYWVKSSTFGIILTSFTPYVANLQHTKSGTPLNQ